LRGGLSEAFGLEALEFLEGLDLGAAGGVDAALEADLVGGTVDEGSAGLIVLFWELASSIS
jgi:hypothetical protein